MGIYLITGVAKKIIIEKTESVRNELTIGNIIEALKKEVNLEFYVFSEDVKYYFWEIKPKIFEGNLVDFLDSQYQMYYETEDKDKHVKEDIDKIKLGKNGEEILKIVMDKDLYCFHLLNNHIVKPSYVLSDNGFTHAMNVYYKLIAIFSDGKIMMECYNNIFRYFENLIRLQRDKYPIVDCVKVMMTD